MYISVYSSTSMAFYCWRNDWASAVHSGSLRSEVKLLLTTSFSPSSFFLTLAILLNFPISFSSTKLGQFLTINYLFPSLTLRTPCSFFLTTWTTRSWSFGLTPAGTVNKTVCFPKNPLANYLRFLTFSFIGVYFY